MSLAAENKRRMMQPPAPRAWPKWLAGLAIAALLYAIFSGVAWNWFRPIVHKTWINQFAGQYKYDPLWVMAIIKVESRFAPNARSQAGAVGLMQLMPSTARELAPEVGLVNFQDKDLERADVNLRIGCYYLSKLQRLFPDDDIAVLSAYNAGPGITAQWRQGKPSLDLDDITYPETREFVKRVESTYHFLKTVQRWKHLFGVDKNDD